MATLMDELIFVLRRADPGLPKETKLVILKEALQAHVLSMIAAHPRYRMLNFYGGTCVRVIYGLDRLSEDLDFDNTQEVDLATFPNDLVRYFHHTLGFVGATAKIQRGESSVMRVTLKFPVLHALGLSPLAGENLHVKIEVSTHKQTAVVETTSVLFHGKSMTLRHFSLETLMAGKMIACLERTFRKGDTETFIKGRDFYDLLWYMQKEIQPLKEKLAKDGKRAYTARSAIKDIGAIVKRIRTSDLAIDLLPLFADRPFIESWLEAFHENFIRFAKPYLQARGKVS